VSYAELLCKSNFSFLEGASHPNELMQRADELGVAALGLVDRNGVYGMPRAYEAQKGLKLRTKLVVGAELTFDDRPPIALIARDRAAYGVLCRMITAAHAGKPKGEPALRWQELVEFAGRPGALGLLAIPREPSTLKLEHDYGAISELFPKRAFFALARLLDGRDGARASQAQDVLRRFGLPALATSDVHLHTPERKTTHDILTAIRHGTTVRQAGTRLFSNRERYLKSPEQMKKLFADLPEALTRTLEIAESCTFSPSELRYRYPSEWIPAGESAQSHLEKLTWKGARERFPQGVPESVEALIRKELRIIEELGYADYFLTIWEIVDFARSRGILCQGRGSAANSVVCYSLGITAVNPTLVNLLFERFVSAERNEPPDIDVDFEHERREEVIQHIYEKYGRDRAGMVAAVVTYGDRLSLRETSKVLADSSLDAEAVQKHADELQGFPRHLSIHSGGFTLSADALIETVPIEPARMDGRTIIQWNKDDLDTIGLIKVDILALGMLTAIRKSLDSIGKQLHELPDGDAATYRMIQKADTVGVFQIESRAQMSMLPRLKPANYYDLVVQVAIVRPGPIVGNMVHPYLRRRRGLEPIDVPHEKLKPILMKTLGVPIFQEQVMCMAIELAGFTPGEADQLRRAIGAWRSSGSIEKLGMRLMEGLRANGLPEEFIERVFKQIQGFAEYGFPESHAASFALLAYASAYLKCHHPAEFTCALLNSQPMGFYSEHTLVDDAKRHGVRVYPVHPQISVWDNQLENGGIRLGWRIVAGMSQEAALRIGEERAARTFDGLADFVIRTRLRQGVLEHLAMGGAFDCFGLSRRDALWQVLGTRASLGAPLLEQAQQSQAQGDLFEPLFDTMSPEERVRAEFSAYGLSTEGHPMQFLRDRIRGVPRNTIQEVRGHRNATSVHIAGYVVVRQRPPTAKGTAFASLEDETGLLDLILHKSVYEKYREVFLEHSFLRVTGTLQKEGDAISLLVRTLAPLFGAEGDAIPKLPIGSGVYFR
jgi:error-prone DNA polymerase